MPRWLTIGQAIHIGLAVLAAIGFFRFWVRTRFWFPRYVHYMAIASLAIGIWLLTIVPADAPVNRSEYRSIVGALFVLLFPAIVYIAFVFGGGQHAAYGDRLRRQGRACPHCGAATILPGTACPSCGQSSTPET